MYFSMVRIALLARRPRTFYFHNMFQISVPKQNYHMEVLMGFWYESVIRIDVVANQKVTLCGNVLENDKLQKVQV